MRRASSHDLDRGSSPEERLRITPLVRIRLRSSMEVTRFASRVRRTRRIHPAGSEGRPLVASGLFLGDLFVKPRSMTRGSLGLAPFLKHVGCDRVKLRHLLSRPRVRG